MSFFLFFVAFFVYLFFFFNDTATTEIYTLSLHDALPILGHGLDRGDRHAHRIGRDDLDRKSTRLNSSHLGISYAVFCLKKKKKNNTDNKIIYKKKKKKKKKKQIIKK